MCSMSGRFLLIFYCGVPMSIDLLMNCAVCNMEQDQIINDIGDNHVCQNTLYLYDFSEWCVPICRKFLVGPGILLNCRILGAGLVRNL